MSQNKLGLQKPASSSAENSKHSNVTFGSHYERDSKTPQKLSKRHLWNALLKEIAKRPNRLCTTKDFATKTQKPASSSAENSKHPNVTFGSHYERDSKTPQKRSIDTSRKRPKPEPKNSFTLPLESTKTSFGPHENLALEHRPRKPRNSKTLSRYLWIAERKQLKHLNTTWRPNF